MNEKMLCSMYPAYIAFNYQNAYKADELIDQLLSLRALDESLETLCQQVICRLSCLHKLKHSFQRLT